MTDFNGQLAQAIKDLIDDLGLTQTAVARQIEKGDSYVSDRLAGRNLAVTGDIVVGIAALSHMQPTTIWRELMSRIETGHGASDR